MKRLLQFLLCFCLLANIAIGECSPATPTDLIEIDDNDYGYIGLSFKREVYIFIEQEPEYIGDEMILIAILVNFNLDDKLTFQWEYSLDGELWEPVENGNEQILTVIIDETNYHYWWKVVVTVM